ncbi:phosphoribosyl-ATP diphosphatase [Candidatus Portiera aleyrodidarum]|uniref:Phosphoribosyl-ATP pyrophosphatase n=1 Tax=Candidatus Portiera aleyrodidarum TaxID=91844 RepID=A0A8D9JPB4_9GAMM|nr:phosphoribosyl-ATP diphosphatase [Candidatus Portiera aleyrodidarum]CEI58578.1 Phosphoribosyl-ATP pyrophosphatase [Candidatus Portiera aleyrodidarum]
MDKILNKLFLILTARKKSDPKKSYVSSLYNKGIKKILKKIKEETNELIIVTKKFKEKNYKDNFLRYEIIKETADLWFHTLICISYLDILHTEILEELSSRIGISGIEEKNNR